jgi:hypothetical protein
MIINDNFIRFFEIVDFFFAFIIANLKFFFSVLIFFEFWKFWTHNMKAMAKDKKVNITVI